MVQKGPRTRDTRGLIFQLRPGLTLTSFPVFCIFSGGVYCTCVYGSCCCCIENASGDCCCCYWHRLVRAPLESRKFHYYYYFFLMIWVENGCRMNGTRSWKAVGRSPLTGLQVPIVLGPSVVKWKQRFSWPISIFNGKKKQINCIIKILLTNLLTGAYLKHICLSNKYRIITKSNQWLYLIFQCSSGVSASKFYLYNETHCTNILISKLISSNFLSRTHPVAVPPTPWKLKVLFPFPP